ncbi:hypothetical protein AGMMS49942_02750 [Spirochaetia bacterium]|nr:hypothetical protein AGMMS49942_02750 [Spirochaetia bacterium]
MNLMETLARRQSALQRILLAGIAHKTDLWVKPKWLPPNYGKRLAMAQKWNLVLSIKATDWGVPVTATEKLRALTGICETALPPTLDRRSCTHVQVAACKKAFADLSACMEDTKNRYFLLPPLTVRDWSLLELPDADGGPSVIGVAVGTMRVGIRHHASNQVSFICDEDPNSKEDLPKVRANHQVGYEVVDMDATGLSMDPNTFGNMVISRSGDIFTNLPAGSSGKKLRAAGRYLNPTDKPGPWGAIVEAVVT